MVGRTGFFYNLIFLKENLSLTPSRDVNLSLDPEIDVRTHGSEVIHLGAINLGSEVPYRAQQDILGGVDVAGTSKPQILAPRAPRFVAPTSEPWISAPTSEPWILAPSMDSKPTAVEAG